MLLIKMEKLFWAIPKDSSIDHLIEENNNHTLHLPLLPLVCMVLTMTAIS